MQIAILGAGFVGESLARALIRAGHEVMLSSRTPQSETIRALIADLGEAAQAGTVQETLAYSDVVAVALPGDAALDVARSAGDWSGKVVLDMTQGDMQALQAITGAAVVKIFNTIGAEHYQDPVFSGEVATMLYCGDDAQAKRVAAQLATDIGFEPVEAGDASVGALLVNQARLWITLMRGGLGRDFAFRLIRK